MAGIFDKDYEFLIDNVRHYHNNILNIYIYLHNRVDT